MPKEDTPMNVEIWIPAQISQTNWWLANYGYDKYESFVKRIPYVKEFFGLRCRFVQVIEHHSAVYAVVMLEVLGNTAITNSDRIKSFLKSAAGMYGIGTDDRQPFMAAMSELKFVVGAEFSPPETHQSTIDRHISAMFRELPCGCGIPGCNLHDLPNLFD